MANFVDEVSTFSQAVARDINERCKAKERALQAELINNGRGAANSFIVKDSGKRQVLSSGMQRDTTEGKTDYSLVLDGPMFKRWAEHLTKGAVKYEKRNWMRASPHDGSYARFRESALRHFLWYWNDTDEDHAAATIFNINGAEYVWAQETLAADPQQTTPASSVSENGLAGTPTGFGDSALTTTIK